MNVIKYVGKVAYGAWGRHGRILQSGLAATLVEGEIVLEPVTSKGMVSTAASLRIPIQDRDAVVKALQSL